MELIFSSSSVFSSLNETEVLASITELLSRRLTVLLNEVSTLSSLKVSVVKVLGEEFDTKNWELPLLFMGLTLFSTLGRDLLSL